MSGASAYLSTAEFTENDFNPTDPYQEEEGFSVQESLRSGIERCCFIGWEFTFSSGCLELCCDWAAADGSVTVAAQQLFGGERVPRNQPAILKCY